MERQTSGHGPRPVRDGRRCGSLGALDQASMQHYNNNIIALKKDCFATRLALERRRVRRFAPARGVVRRAAFEGSLQRRSETRDHAAPKCCSVNVAMVCATHTSHYLRFCRDSRYAPCCCGPRCSWATQRRCASCSSTTLRSMRVSSAVGRAGVRLEDRTDGNPQHAGKGTQNSVGLAHHGFTGLVGPPFSIEFYENGAQDHGIFLVTG